MQSTTSAVDLYWIPLGAGGAFVRFNGKVFEALGALVERRARRDLYHSALEVTTPDCRYVIEMTPIPRAYGVDRGVVVEGPVGARLAGRFRIFRYEIRRWANGAIPDVSYAIASPVRVSSDAREAQRVLDLVPQVPALVWGRDALRAGDMWNSNSVVSWLLASSRMNVVGIEPPPGGRAPGWEAGLAAARRAQGSRLVQPGSAW
jgi:hypothetical protein